jgi:hypothetical protein
MVSASRAMSSTTLTEAPSIHRWLGGRCREAGVRPSMGSVGDAYDNAMCESFFATLECELLARRRFTSRAEARMAVFSYIEGWYNPARRHFGIRYYPRLPTRSRCSRKPKRPKQQTIHQTGSTPRPHPSVREFEWCDRELRADFGLSALDPSVLRLRQPRHRLKGWYAQHTTSHSRFGDRFTRRSSALHPCRARPPTHTHYAGASCACNRTERGEEERRVGDISDAARAGPGTSSTPTWCCRIKA